MTIGERLRLFREFKKYTQATLASIANVNEKFYGKIERDESSPTLNTLEKICKALEISIIEFFLVYSAKSSKKNFIPHPPFVKLIVNQWKNDIDIHFNRDNIVDKLTNCIWYNGYIGSLSFDEFEFKLYATGNIRAKLYIDFVEVLSVNHSDVGSELSVYIGSDHKLVSLIEHAHENDALLSKKQGNALFILESNWLQAKLINNSTNEIIVEGIILDTDNILDALGNHELLFKLIFQ